MSDTDALMKRCQIGDGRWPDAANDLLAECYGRLGWQQSRIRELELVNADLYEALEAFVNNSSVQVNQPYECERAEAALVKARGDER